MLGALFAPQHVPVTQADSRLLQVVWADVGSMAWQNTDSSQFYIDLALRSRDPRYDGKRPRIRVSTQDLADLPKLPKLNWLGLACHLNSGLALALPYSQIFGPP